MTSLDYTPMDYATLFETQFRPRRRLRRALARLVWASLFVVRPKLALEIWRSC